MPGDSGAISTMSSNKDTKVELLIKNTTKLEDSDAKEDEDFEEFEIQEIDEIELDEPLPEKTASKEEEQVDPNDFREKIKRRLQKALQSKKK